MVRLAVNAGMDLNLHSTKQASALASMILPAEGNWMLSSSCYWCILLARQMLGGSRGG